MENVFLLGNQARNLKAYELANVIFSYLIHKCIGERTERETALSLVLETQDLDGKSLRQTNYDVLWIKSQSGAKMCAPLPKIKSEVICTILKRGLQVTEEEKSSGAFTDKTEKELWDEFFLLLCEQEKLNGRNAKKRFLQKLHRLYLA